MNAVGWVCISLLAATWPLTVFAQDTRPAAKPRASEMSAAEKAEYTAIADELASSDSAKHQSAIQRIEALLNKRTEPGIKFNAQWISRLAELKLYDDAEALALGGLFSARTDVVRFSAIQRARVKALSASGNYDAAVSAAKGYYNACTIAQTEDAIDLLGGLLQRSRPNDAGIAQRFKMQQVAAATTRPATQPTQAEKSILTEIQIDAAPFEPLLERLQNPHTYTNLLARGNILLLCDRTAEAKECFEKALEVSKGDTQQTHATEGIARSIRAMTGSIGQTNEFLLSHKQK